jgi:transcriptional regulator with XRE-family HTH domain
MLVFKWFIVCKNEVLRVDFGDELKRIRESRGMTVNQLAIYSGVSAATISRVENKKRGTPRPKYIKMLAEALRYDYNDLMRLAGYTDDKNIKDSSIVATEEDKLRKIAADKIQKINNVDDLNKAIDHLDYLESRNKG